METNFKVDVPSFALGYSAGKKKGGSGGGAELNIAYGDTPPEDTTKLWVKTSEPSGVLVSTNPDYEERPANTVTMLSAKMYAPIIYSSAEAIGDDIYVFGGRNGNDNKLTNVVQRFNTKTLTIEAEITMPISMDYVTTAVYNSEVYILGGSGFIDSVYTRLNTILRFDPITKTFVTLDTVLPIAICDMGAACVGSKIYMFGGYSNDGYTDSIYCFDVQTETITTIPVVLPTTLRGANAAVIGTTIYIVYTYNMVQNIFRFDTETETLSTLKYTNPTSVAVSKNPCFIAMGDYLYMYPGHRTTIVRYNPITQTAGTVKDFPRESIDASVYYEYRDQMVGGLVDGKVYTFGGTYKRNSSSTYHSSSIYCHNPMGGKDYLVEENDLLIIPHMEGYTFPIINAESTKIEIGVDSVYKGNEEGKGEEVEAALYKDGAWTTI